MRRKKKIQTSITPRERAKLKQELREKQPDLPDETIEEVLDAVRSIVPEDPEISGEIQVLILRNVHLINTPRSFKRGQKVRLPLEFAEKLIRGKNAKIEV